MSTIPKSLARSALAALALAASTPARAVEGAVQYPHGAEGLSAGALPPPGTYGLAYGIHYGGARKDGRGDELLVGGEKVELGVNAVALRLVHMTELRILGAQYGVHAIVPFFTNSVTVGGLSDRNTGLGDVTFAPFILAWHRETVHWAVAADVFAPTGAYSSTRRLGNNLGANYWSFEPLAAVTWLPGAGWDVNAKLMYNLKAKNTATDYRSGDELHADFAAGKAVTSALRLGLGGYVNAQLRDDRVAGVDVGNRARYLGIGPEVAFQAGAVSLLAKWHQEVYARNAFQGSRFTLKFVAAF